VDKKEIGMRRHIETLELSTLMKVVKVEMVECLEMDKLGRLEELVEMAKDLQYIYNRNLVGDEAYYLRCETRDIAIQMAYDGLLDGLDFRFVEIDLNN
jgi:hypothetical protein